jgi:tetratricopeptide (TPR) repeat protein
MPDFSVNVRVRRSCGDRPCEAAIQLADDPNNSSPVSDERYWPVSIAGQPAKGGPIPAALVREPLPTRVYSALLHLDALDADGAATLLQESQDPHLLPLLGSALLASGHPETAIIALSRLSQTATDEAVRLWAVEQMALSHSLMGSSALAQGEYSTLIATGNPPYQDIGVSGLVDLALGSDNGDAAMAAYRTTFDGTVAPGMRSASRLSNWLQKRGRMVEAIDILTRASESTWAQDSERAMALLQLQSLYARSGNVEKALAAGWNLQEISPRGDRSGSAGLKMLIGAVTSGRTAASSAAPFSESYQSFIDRNPQAVDPAREIAYAAELQREHKVDAAAALYDKVANEDGALLSDRAAAMLGLQRLRLESGQLAQSVQTGMAIHERFPQDLAARMASWRLIRLASLADGVPNGLQQQAQNVGRVLAEDLRSSAQSQIGIETRRAQALLRQFTKEANQ